MEPQSTTQSTGTTNTTTENFKTIPKIWKTENFPVLSKDEEQKLLEFLQKVSKQLDEELN